MVSLRSCVCRDAYQLSMLLMQVRGLLWKLQAVFDLPRRLRSAIDNGAYEIAVNSYADAEPLLKRYGHKVRLSGHITSEPPQTISARKGQLSVKISTSERKAAAIKRPFEALQVTNGTLL